MLGENIKNIIFDMGDVLIEFNPDKFMDQAGVTDIEDRKLLKAAVFDTPNWKRMDTGEWDEPEMLEYSKSVLPERLHGGARQLIYSWDEPIIPIEGMAELVKECKDRGCGIYLLSNASRRQHEYWVRIPGHELFDGTVISADILCKKPSPGIYENILSAYGLKAEECIFIDDVTENVEAARAVGISAYQFDGDVNKLRAHLFS